MIVLEHSGAPHEALFYLDEALRKGESLISEGFDPAGKDRPEASDLASIIYTSGTTGEPKGVMLTHDNFVSNAKAGLARFEFRESDTTIVFLPLAHSFERLACYAYILEGLKISYAESIDRLLANLRDVRPTVMCAVPRLYERIYGRLMENASRSNYLKKYFIHGGQHCRKVGKGQGHGEQEAVLLSPLRESSSISFSTGGSGPAQEAGSVLRLRGRGDKPRPRSILLRRRPEDSAGLRPHGDRSGPDVQQRKPHLFRFGGSSAGRCRDKDRHRRRDPRARPEHHERLFQERGRDKGVLHRGRLVQDGRHRPSRREDEAVHHGPQEGTDSHRWRKEHRPAAH